MDDSLSSQCTNLARVPRSAYVVLIIITTVQYLWKSTRDALIGVVKKSIQYDEDGIDLHFFNSRVVKEGLNTAEGLKDLFVTVEPFNGTPTATALKRVLEPYLLKLEAAYGAKREKPDVKTETIKPLNVVVVTDGEPNPGYSPERVIVVSLPRHALAFRLL